MKSSFPLTHELREGKFVCVCLCVFVCSVVYVCVLGEVAILMVNCFKVYESVK